MELAQWKDDGIRIGRSKQAVATGGVYTSYSPEQLTHHCLKLEQCHQTNGPLNFPELPSHNSCCGTGRERGGR